MTVTVPSFAKINWVLEVLGRREDGYHELRTVLQTISLTDLLSFTETDQKIELTCNTPGVPRDKTNLIVRAAALLKATSGIEFGVRVHLEKRIPLAAGLGGGSSNAATTLLVLRRMWKTGLEPERLIELGALLGADVPFFLQGGTAIGTGRGDEVHALPEVHFENLLLVNPGIAVPTREVYQALPAGLTKSYTADMMPFSLEATRQKLSHPGALPDLLRNDLEQSVTSRYPLLNQIKDRLKSAGAIGTLMSGSGATIFALFESEATRFAAQQELDHTGWWYAPVRTVDRSEYRSALGVTDALV